MRAVTRLFRCAVLFAPLLALTACGERDFLYFEEPRLPGQRIQKAHNLADLQSDSDVDILWIIDNSGSMDYYQKEVIRNTQVFMQEFTKNTLLSWKMGLVSTDESQAAFLGSQMYPAVDSLMPNPVTAFQSAVGRLGTWGSGTEKAFGPIMKFVKENPGFHRKGNYFAMIIVTDAPEQGYESATELLTFLKTQVEPLKRVVTYGVFSPTDMNCVTSDDAWAYKGSKYEELILATRGKAYRLCDPNFGMNLADMGKDLVSRVTNPRIYLSGRPIPESIQVLHHGVALPGGSKEDGGFWTYDYEVNAVTFHDLSFAPNDQESVEVIFQEDTGA